MVLTLLTLGVGSWSCAVKREIHVSPPQVSAPPRQATVSELVKEVDAWSEEIHTLTATVQFKPTTGSVYTGVIKEYQNVGGFILLKKPSTIRIIGQAPVVKTEIFDMVSDGQQFRVFIPPKNKFIVGDNSYHGPADKPLENLRPEHILDALLVPAIDEAREKFFNEVTLTPTGQSYYVINVVEQAGGGGLTLKRRVWFDRSNLSLSRLQLYGSDGTLLEDIHYTDYHDFGGIRYPSEITLSRPDEDYTLSIEMEKVTFNQPIPPQKFVLKRPPNTTLVELKGDK